MKKFLIMGDSVISKTDGDRHHLSARKIAELYGVDPKECHLIDDPEAPVPKGELILLRPRYHGDYGEYLASVKKSFPAMFREEKKRRRP